MRGAGQHLLFLGNPGVGGAVRRRQTFGGIGGVEDLARLGLAGVDPLHHQRIATAPHLAMGFERGAGPEPGHRARLQRREEPPLGPPPQGGLVAREAQPRDRLRKRHAVRHRPHVDPRPVEMQPHIGAMRLHALEDVDAGQHMAPRPGGGRMQHPDRGQGGRRGGIGGGGRHRPRLSGVFQGGPVSQATAAANSGQCRARSVPGSAACAAR